MSGPKVDNHRLPSFTPRCTKIGTGEDAEYIGHVILVDASGNPLVTVPVSGPIEVTPGAGFASAVLPGDPITSTTEHIPVAVKDGSGNAASLLQPTTPSDTQPVSGSFYPTPPTALTQSKVSVTASTVLLAANANRKGGFIQMVTATGVCHINHGGAATTNHAFIMNKGHVYEIPRGLVGAVYGIAASGTIEVIAAEYT